MEDKIVVTVPALDVDSSTTYAPDKSHVATYGPGVGGIMALHFNLIQFMCGVPVVDYDSIAVSAGGSPSGQIVLIDTARRADLYNEFDSLDAATDDYADFNATYVSTRGTTIKSQATGTYTISVTGSNYTISNGAAMQLSGGGTTFSFNVVNDVYDSGGDFHFSICLMDSAGAYYTSGPSPGAWSTATITFDVVNPTYTTNLNWAESCTTTRYDNNYVSHVSGLYFDTFKGDAIGTTDPITDIAAVGIYLDCNLAALRSTPLQKIDGQIAAALGEFFTPTGSYPSISTCLASGRSFSSNTFQQPTQWTILRGPGYVRIFAEHPSDATLSNVYYLGLMKAYMRIEQYESPLAFLGDTDVNNGASNYNSPWWRKFDYDDTVTTVSPSYRYDTPFIINDNFTFGSTADLESCVHFPLSIRSASNQPDLSVTTGLTKTFTKGSKTDSVKAFASPFDTGGRESWWDTTVLWNTAANGIGARMTGTNLQDRHLEPVVFFQCTDDGYDWNTSDSYELLFNYPTTSNREAMGCLPGIYWMNDKLLYVGSTLEDIDPTDALTVYVGGQARTLRVAVGYSYGSGNNGVKGPQTTGEDHGVVVFDMNEV